MPDESNCFIQFATKSGKKIATIDHTKRTSPSHMTISPMKSSAKKRRVRKPSNQINVPAFLKNIPLETVTPENLTSPTLDKTKSMTLNQFDSVNDFEA